MITAMEQLFEDMKQKGLTQELQLRFYHDYDEIIIKLIYSRAKKYLVALNQLNRENLNDFCNDVRNEIYSDLFSITRSYLKHKQPYPPFRLYLVGVVKNKVIKEIQKKFDFHIESVKEILRSIVEAKKESTRRSKIAQLKARKQNEVKAALMATYSEPDVSRLTDRFFDEFIPQRYPKDEDERQDNSWKTPFKRLLREFIDELGTGELGAAPIARGGIPPYDPDKIKMSTTEVNNPDSGGKEEKPVEGSSNIQKTISIEVQNTSRIYLDKLIRCSGPHLEDAKKDIGLWVSASASQKDRDIGRTCLACAALKQHAFAAEDNITIRNLRIFLIHEASHAFPLLRPATPITGLRMETISLDRVGGNRYTVKDVCSLFGIGENPNIPTIIRQRLTEIMAELSSNE
jgi:hypothetical protein